MTTTWIQTYRGGQFHVAEPRAADVHIEDIAHALSLLCRYTGHARFFYSVAQHSVLVSHACDAVDAMHGLLHDAAEAYLGDVSAPLKGTMYLAGYRALEARVQDVVWDRFRLSRNVPKSVHVADLVLLSTEARDVMGPAPAPWGLMYPPLATAIEPQDPWQAERRFLERYHELGGR